MTKILSCYIIADTLMTLSVYFTMNFLSYLNSRHPNIRFGFETHLNGKHPFLDVLVDNSGASYIISIYLKSTYTGLLTNFLSFTCFKCKVGLIYTLG